MYRVGGYGLWGGFDDIVIQHIVKTHSLLSTAHSYSYISFPTVHRTICKHFAHRPHNTECWRPDLTHISTAMLCMTAIGQMQYTNRGALEKARKRVLNAAKLLVTRQRQGASTRTDVFSLQVLGYKDSLDQIITQTVFKTYCAYQASMHR